MAFTSLFWPDPGAARAIGVVIVLSFLWACILLAACLVRTRAEASEVPAPGEKPETALAVMAGRLSPTRVRLATLAEYRGRREAVDANEAASAHQERTFDANLSWVRYFVAALLFLGLMGTVVGLATTIGNLRPILDSAQVKDLNDLKNIVRAIGTVIGAMRNAFACTLLGILSSILCSLGAQTAQTHYQRRVLRPLDEYCSRRLVPFLSRSPEYDLFAQAARGLGETVSRSAEVVRAQQALQEAFGRRVEEVARLLEQAGAAAGGKLSEAGTSVGQHLAQAGRSLTKDMGIAGAALSGNLGTSSAQAAEALQTASAQLGGQMDRTARWLASVSPSLETALTTLTASQTRLAAVVGETEASVASLKAQLAGIEGLSRQSLEGLKGVHEAGEEAARASSTRMAEQFNAHLRKVEAAGLAGERQMQALASLVSEVSERQETLLRTVEAYTQRTDGTLGSLVKSQEQHAGTIQDISRQQLTALEAQMNDFRGAVGALKGLIEDVEVAFRDAVSTVQVAAPPSRDGGGNGRTTRAEEKVR